MNMPCGVIRDLLPLYAEELTSEESKEIVREHLDGCPDCRKKLEELQHPKLPAPDGAAALRAVKKDIRRRRTIAVLLAALLVFLPLFALLARSMEEIALPYDDRLACVEEREDGNLSVIFDGRVTGVESIYEKDQETGEITLVLQAWTSRWHQRFAGDEQGCVYTADKNLPITRVLYGYGLIHGFGAGQVLLYGKPMSGGVQILPRLTLGFYLLLSLIAAAIFGVLWLCLRKRKAAPELRALFFAALAYPIGHLLVKGTETLSFFLPRDLAFILIAAAAVWGLMMLGWTFWKRKRAEKNDPPSVIANQ